MRAFVCVAVVALLLVSVGCTFPMAPVMAGLVIDQKGPVSGVENFDMKSMKTGRSQAQGIILVGFGDASITTAAKNGAITKVHHVDSNSLNVLGIYSKYETIVYGE